MPVPTCADLETWFSDAVPEDPSHWRHTLEEPDDMPAHVKSVLIGPSLTIPVLATLHGTS